MAGKPHPNFNFYITTRSLLYLKDKETIHYEISLLVTNLGITLSGLHYTVHFFQLKIFIQKTQTD